LHAPPAQVSALAGSQTLQVPPAVPHVVMDAVLHTSPAQQPLGHVVESHTHAPEAHFEPGLQAGPVPHEHAPAVHVSATVESHVEQPAPPVPHAVTELLHTLPAQHPVAHEAALHTHAPPTHCWPAAHGAPLPHLHVPPLHVSASMGSHFTHALPAAPHASLLGAVHVEPSQQPVVQVAEQPEQVPPTHV
jgi:hypothetical protein